MARSITEENNKDLLEAWFDAKPESIDAFITVLNRNYNHDYGTVCYAVAAAGYQAAMKMATEQGITGFQAGAVFWIFKRFWTDYGVDKPARLVDYSDFLYPQYQDKHEKTITESTWEWLQGQAKTQLESFSSRDDGFLASEAVIAHWQAIVDGVVPFGYKVRG